MPEDKYMFGRRLRRILDQKEITQTQLADAIGCGRKSISGWMNGDNKPGYEYIRSMAQTLDVSADYLLGLYEEPLAPPKHYVSREEFVEFLQARRRATK